MPNNEFDADIDQMPLDYGEKSGMQMYRNYTKAFREHAVQKFVAMLDQEILDLTDYKAVTAKIACEDGRYLPVIICAYADDVLKDSFKRSIPTGVPGGKDGLFGGYGPLSSFSKLIQIAYAFDILSGDLMQELDKVRTVRNKLAHSWNVQDLDQFFNGGRLADISPIEKMIFEREEFSTREIEQDPLIVFRIRMIWIVGRLVYEAAGGPRAKMANLPRQSALFGPLKTKWLSQISTVAMEATRQLLPSNVQTERDNSH